MLKCWMNGCVMNVLLLCMFWLGFYYFMYDFFLKMGLELTFHSRIWQSDKTLRQNYWLLTQIWPKVWKEEDEDLTWMSSDVKCPFMSLFFFLGGGGAGLWAGGRSVLLREWKDNMTLSTVRDRHSLRPSPSTPLYYEKSCLHLPFSLFPRILIDLVLVALLRRQPFPLPCQRLSLERHCANESGL